MLPFGDFWIAGKWYEFEKVFYLWEILRFKIENGMIFDIFQLSENLFLIDFRVFYRTQYRSKNVNIEHTLTLHFQISYKCKNKIVF